jgi:C4-dicarboxylate transporter, DctQ subunit
MGRFWKIIDWVQDRLKMAGAVCLLGMTLLTCADIVGRLFGHPIFGSVEIVGFMAILAVAMAMPYAHKIKSHIGVEILWQVFSEKTRMVIDLCTGVASLGLFGLVTWRMTLYAHTMQKSGEVSMNLELPEHLIVYAVAFCFMVFTLIILKELIENFKKLRDR